MIVRRIKDQISKEIGDGPALNLARAMSSVCQSTTNVIFRSRDTSISLASQIMLEMDRLPKKAHQNVWQATAPQQEIRDNYGTALVFALEADRKAGGQLYDADLPAEYDQAECFEILTDFADERVRHSQSAILLDQYDSGEDPPSDPDDNIGAAGSE
uniref:Ferritin-like domain-containing protein n=1 Tax=Angiostrongylus cantonensis TaxID=6313 RepID=A0A0K0CWI2_ANGCA